MWKDIVFTVLLLGMVQVLAEHRKRQSHPTSFKSLLGWRDIAADVDNNDDKSSSYTPPVSSPRKYGNYFWGLRWVNNPELLGGLQIRKRVLHSNALRDYKKMSKDLISYPFYEMSKRQDYSCDTTRITIQTIIEYLRTGRICGFRVSTMRFGLGRRR
ncbi:hypothetical protein SNE40_001317 [Patella caerulea]